MDHSEEQQSAGGGRIDDADRVSNGGDPGGVSPDDGAETSETATQSVARRLTDMFVAGGDGDLSLQSEGGFLQWIRALDMQAVGACRADERLKPLLMLNVSAGVAEDGLLAHLSQHFEPSEVGLLARCLCVPLVSIRVGKINQEGSVMTPTSVRGNLCLTLLPTSDLRIAFNGDDGSVERLTTLTSEVQCTGVEIEEIPADKSGRSFLIKTSDSTVSYFWCSEKSKLAGDELIRKMNDLLMRKPSLAELTGISEPRLSYFASHLRAYLTDTVVNNAQAAVILSDNPSDDSVNSSELSTSHSSNFPKTSCLLQYGSSQGSNTNLFYLGSLSPQPSSFEGMQKDLSSTSENYAVSLSLASSNLPADPSSLTCFQKDKFPEVVNTAHTLAAFNFLNRKSSELPIPGSEIQTPSSGSSSFSPQYCWCPIGNPQQLPISSSEPFSLPPLSSLLSSRSSGLNVTELPPLDFPTLLPEPIVRFSSSQQILTYTPIICDPIIHIPVIDVCSSGQAYFVSAGLGMSTTISPLVDPNAESAVDKGARETLRMLINSSSSHSSGDQNVFATGSRGLYGGTRDVVAMTNSMSSVGLVLLSEKSVGGGMGKMFAGVDDLIDQDKGPGAGSSGFDEGMG